MIETKLINRNLVIYPSPNYISSFYKNFCSITFSSNLIKGNFDRIIVDELGEIRYFHTNSVFSIINSLPKPAIHATLCSNYSSFSNFQDKLPSIDSNDYMIWLYRRDLPQKEFFNSLTKIKYKVLFLNGKFRFGRYYFDQKVKKYINTSDWIYTSNNFFSPKFLNSLKNKSKTLEEYVLDKVVEKYRSNFLPLEEKLNFSTNNQTGYGKEELVAWPVASNYNNTFLELITETFADNGLSQKLLDANAICVTEKTFKPILAGRPFIINANPGFLSNLRSMGFKTFTKWWDESYDSILDIDERHTVILKNLNYINSLTNSQLLDMYMEMLPIIKHNYVVAINFMKGKKEVEKLVGL